MIPLTDYARFVDERAHALAALLMRVIDGLVMDPLRAVDDARVIDEDEEEEYGMHCGLCRSPEPDEETP